MPRQETPTAARLAEAIRLAERRLCGRALTRRRATADGLALTGSTAIALFDDTALGGDHPWIAHRVRIPSAPPPAGHAFELIAATPQDAIDHCIVAHRLATALGRSGICSVDAAMAERPCVVRLPAGPDSPAAERSTQDVAMAADAAFEAVSELTGRPIAAATMEAIDGASVVLVAAGAQAVPARRIAASVRDAGVACGCVTFALRRPFPFDSLRSSLGGAASIAVLDAGDGRLLEDVRRAIGHDGAKVFALPSGEIPADIEPVLRAASEKDRTPDEREIVVGAVPAGAWSEALLFEMAALAGSDGPVELSLPKPVFDDVSSIAIHTGALPETETFDVIFAVGPELLRREHVEALRPGGVVVVQGDAPLALGESVHAAFAGRPVSIFGIERSVSDFREIAGALLAAHDGFSKVVGGDPPASLRGARLLERAATTIPAPQDVGSPSPPRERAPAKDAAPEAWRERLHHFHLTGQGAYQACDPSPALPLVPESLAALVAAEAGSNGEQPSLDGTAVGTYAEIVGGSRSRRRFDLASKIDRLLERLREKTGSEGGGTGLESALGQAGSSFFDADALQRAVSHRPATAELAQDRRTRMVDAIECLEAYRERLASSPHLIVVGGGSDDPAVTGSSSVLAVPHEDGLGAAVGIFDGEAARLVEAVRAMRTARLDVSGEYDPAFHDPIFERLDWQGLSEDELLSMPAIVVAESAERLRGPQLAALSEVLQSGRPLHVLALQHVAGLWPDEDDDGGYDPGLGYLAIAHREALVLQATPVRSRHLLDGFERMAQALTPALAVVAQPSRAIPFPDQVQLAAALWGRATPCFLYDPSKGLSWADRFDLSGNPSPAAKWPTLSVERLGAGGEPCRLERQFTLAHAAMLDPACRPHVRLVPDEAYGDDQLDVDAWIERPAVERRSLLPYVSVLGSDGELERAAVTRVMAFACRDRSRAWRILQELAGEENVYAARAAETARMQALEEAAEIGEQIAAEHTGQLAAARSQATSAAIDRLVRVLAGGSVDVAALAVAAPSAAPADVPDTADQVEQVSTTSDEPYIESVLCTTCNECTKLNGKLFRYNADRQAEIGDPKAGTYAQLVRAAELCPARCIHPGAPREGDSTATDALIARAAKFR